MAEGVGEENIAGERNKGDGKGRHPDTGLYTSRAGAQEVLVQIQIPRLPQLLEAWLSRSGVQVLDPRIYLLKRCPDNTVKASLLSLPVVGGSSPCGLSSQT